MWDWAHERHRITTNGKFAIAFTYKCLFATQRVSTEYIFLYIQKCSSLTPSLCKWQRRYCCVYQLYFYIYFASLVCAAAVLAFCFFSDTFITLIDSSFSKSAWLVKTCDVLCQTQAIASSIFYKIKGFWFGEKGVGGGSTYIWVCVVCS